MLLARESPSAHVPLLPPPHDALRTRRWTSGPGRFDYRREPLHGVKPTGNVRKPAEFRPGHFGGLSVRFPGLLPSTGRSAVSLAMQKVESSSPFSRLKKSPAQGYVAPSVHRAAPKCCLVRDVNALGRSSEPTQSPRRPTPFARLEALVVALLREQDASEPANRAAEPSHDINHKRPARLPNDRFGDHGGAIRAIASARGCRNIGAVWWV